MRLQVQPEGVGICGQVSMAMVLDVDYAEVLKHLPKEGTNVLQRKVVLQTYYSATIRGVFPVDNRKTLDFSGRGIVAISTTSGKRHGHAMAFEDGKIYDPGGVTFEGYRAMLDYYQKRWNGARIRHIAYVDVPQPQDELMEAGD